ncbi:MAG: hypothetical protein ACI4ME_04510 [Aristaeellaceae bacterium]
MKIPISPFSRFFIGISILLFLAFRWNDTSSMGEGKRKDADFSWREFTLTYMILQSENCSRRGDKSSMMIRTFAIDKTSFIWDMLF